MGTISQKISYLAETKQRQKTLINALGGNITNDTPFREYEKELVGVLPKVTGEGTNISLSPTIEYDLEVESYKGDTSQDGTPTPDTPVDIQVVTGTQEIKVVGKNLYDNSKHNNQWVSPTGIASVSGANIQKVKCSSGDTYTMSVTFESSGGNSVCVMAFYNESDTLLERSVISGVTSGSLTKVAPANTSYMYVGHYINTPITMQVEKSSQATTYEPYTSQTYTLHLGDLELAKIGSYQDYIYYDNGKWYKYGAIGKHTLSSSDTINYEGSFPRFSVDNIDLFPNTEDRQLVYCNRYSYISSGSADYGIFSYYQTHRVYIYDKDYSSVDNLKTYFTNNNTYFYYMKNTPTSTEITNETLLSDLEYIRTHAKSYSGTTNISSSGNLPIIISASALKQLS